MPMSEYRIISEYYTPDNVSNTQRIPTAVHVRKSHSALIPATGAPPERIVSTAGLTVTSRRSQLLPSNVNKIIFVYENERFC